MWVAPVEKHWYFLSVHSPKMQAYFDSIAANDSRGDPLETDDTFRKEHELEFIATWCRVRMEGSEVQVRGVDGRVLEGAIDKISDVRGTSKKKCAWVDTLWIQDKDTVKSNEFFHEAGLCKLVKDHLSDLPTFARGTLQSAKLDSKGGRGWLTFLRVPGVELETIVNDLSPDEMKSIMLQVLASICIAQQRIKLKHHDLHLFNVLVHPAAESDAKQWSVETPFGLLHIPIVGMHASIIDFGLSSATDPESGKRLVRLDEELLTKPKKDEPSDDWGVWGPTLEGDTGYDVAMFVESFVEELFRDRPLNIPKLQIVASLQELFDIDFTDRGRPMETCVVDWPRVFAVLGGVLEESSSG